MEATKNRRGMKWTDLHRVVHKAWPMLSILASGTIIMCAIPRGLDLTDESLYVLLAQTDAPRSLSVIHTQLLFQWLNATTGLSLGVKGLRVARLVLLLTSTGWLTWVLSKSLKPASKIMFALSALSFALLQYTGNGRIFSLGYNALNWTWGIWFIASWIRWVRDSKPLSPFSMGGALALMWITKFPSAIMLGGFGILLVLFHPEFRRKSLYRALGMALIPFVIVMVLAPLSGHEVWPWSYLEQVASSQDDKHSTDSLLIHSLVEVARTYLPLIPLATLGILTKRHPLSKTHDNIVCFLLTGAFIGLACLDSLTLRNFRLGYWLIAGGLLVWSLSRTNDGTRRLVGTLFLLAPIGLTLGTDVSWAGHLMSVSGLILLAALWLASNQWVSMACIAIPLLILPDIGLHPYRQAPLSQVTNSIEIKGTNETICISSAVQNYLDSIQILTITQTAPLIGSDRSNPALARRSTPPMPNCGKTQPRDWPMFSTTSKHIEKIQLAKGRVVISPHPHSANT